MTPYRDPIASEPWVTAGARDHKKHNGDQVSVAAVYPNLFSNLICLTKRLLAKNHFFRKSFRAYSWGIEGGIKS